MTQILGSRFFDRFLANQINIFLKGRKYLLKFERIAVNLKPFMRAGLIWFDDFKKQSPFSVLRGHAAQPVVPLQAVSHSSAEPTPCLSPMGSPLCQVRKVSSRAQPDQPKTSLALSQGKTE